MSLYPSETATCVRCGIRRNVHGGRDTAVCRDCRREFPEPTDADKFDGHIVRVGVVWKFIPTPPVEVARKCHCGDYYPAGGSCETCLVWAEKDARLHAEARQSRANRHVVWDILAARKEREEAA